MPGAPAMLRAAMLPMDQQLLVKLLHSNKVTFAANNSAGWKPLLVLTLLPLERLPGLEVLSEVTAASKTICLYAFGGTFAPLQTLAAGTLLATSAAVCEEPGAPHASRRRQRCGRPCSPC